MRNDPFSTGSSISYFLPVGTRAPASASGGVRPRLVVFFPAVVPLFGVERGADDSDSIDSWYSPTRTRLPQPPLDQVFARSLNQSAPNTPPRRQSLRIVQSLLVLPQILQQRMHRLLFVIVQIFQRRQLPLHSRQPLR